MFTRAKLYLFRCQYVFYYSLYRSAIYLLRVNIPWMGDNLEGGVLCISPSILQ